MIQYYNLNRNIPEVSPVCESRKVTVETRNHVANDIPYIIMSSLICCNELATLLYSP